MGMELEKIQSNEELLSYIEGLVNDFCDSEQDKKAKKDLCNEILGVGIFMAEKYLEGKIDETNNTNIEKTNIVGKRFN